jgi:HEPN domain-containing protein
MKEGEIWFHFAEEDLRMAKLALKEGIYNQVCFHSQQAVEKALKAHLESNNVMPPKTHKIVDLISKIKTEMFKDLRNNLILLDRFYIPTRYPDALPGSLSEGLPRKEDAEESLKLAVKIVERVKKGMLNSAP